MVGRDVSYWYHIKWSDLSLVCATGGLTPSIEQKLFSKLLRYYVSLGEQLHVKDLE